ncbi:MAG: hypothetical protein QM754_06550 [Tepidisphaeraceae bacterium]
MAHCADRNCACPMPPNARFCPRCGRKAVSNAGWMFMAFGVLLMLVIGLFFIRFETNANSSHAVEAAHEMEAAPAPSPVSSRPPGNFWRP